MALAAIALKLWRKCVEREPEVAASLLEVANRLAPILRGGIGGGTRRAVDRETAVKAAEVLELLHEVQMMSALLRGRDASDRH